MVYNLITELFVKIKDALGNTATVSDVGDGKKGIDVSIHGASVLQLGNLTGNSPVSVVNGFGSVLSPEVNISVSDAKADGITKGVSSFVSNDFKDSAGVISINYLSGQSASSTQKGLLTPGDWTNFNNKFDAPSRGNLVGITPIAVSNGTNSVFGSGSNITVADATTSQKGAVQLSNVISGSSEIKAVTEKALSDGLATKEPVIVKGNLSATSPLSQTGGNGAVIGAGVSLNIQDASISQKGAVQLSNSYSGTLQNLATTEKALSDGLTTKEPVIVKGNLTSVNNKIGLTGGTGAVIGAGTALTLNEGNIVHQNISGAGTNNHANLDLHLASISNPHSTTAVQVGLGNVTNDAQVKKRVSSTPGNVPTWNGITGDALNDGYGVETALVGGAGNLVRADAIKAYVDNVVAASDAMVYKGIIDCSGNPNYPLANAGWTYKISVAGKIGGASGLNVEIGDMIICLVDTTPAGNQATVGTAWNIIQANLDGAVIGPVASINNRIAAFNGATGKSILDSGYLAQDASTTQKGFTQLSNLYNGISQVLSVTEKALSDGLATKEPIVTKGNLSANSPLSQTGGVGAIIGTGVSLNIQDASTTQKGATQLSNLYNGTSQILSTTEKALNDGLATKEPTVTKGNLTAASNKIVLAGSTTGALIGAGASVDIVEANLTLNNLGGILSISKGGTGQITANASLNALLPSQAGQNSKVLQTDGINTSWVSPSGGGAVSNRCRVERTLVQSIPNSTDTKISYNSVTFDSSTEWDTVNFRFVAKNSGYYQINTSYTWAASTASTTTWLGLYKNGVSYSYVYGYKVVNKVSGVSLSDIAYLAVGDNIEIWVWQDAGSAKNIAYANLSIHRLS